jgi:hypothetical protein
MLSDLEAFIPKPSMFNRMLKHFLERWAAIAALFPWKRRIAQYPLPQSRFKACVSN